MTATSSIFSIRLADLVSGPAKSATSASVALKEQIEKQAAAVRALSARYAQLKAGGLGTSEAAKQVRGQMSALRTSTAGLVEKLAGLKDGMEIEPPTKPVAGFLDALSRAGGPIGSFVSRIQSIPVAAVGIGALVVAIGAVVTVAIRAARAIVDLTLEVTRFGIESANARRSQELHIEGLTRMRGAARFAAMGAGEVMTAIDRVSGIAAIGRSEVAGYAEQLFRAGVRGVALDQALEGISITAAAGGSGAANRFFGMAVGAARAGRSVRAFVDDARARFGSINARMGLDLGRQATRLRESFAALFGGSRVGAALERFLQRIGDIQSLFSQTTATGRGLRAIVEAIFPQMLDSSTELLPVVRRVFQLMVLGGLRATLVFVNTRRALRSVWRAVTDGMPTLEAMARAFGVVQALIGGRFLDAATQVANAMPGLWRSIGEDSAHRMAEGLVLGIRSRVAAVTAEVASFADGAAAAFRDSLGIRSPSRVFAEFGRHVAGGVAEGVDDGAPRAERAVADLVSVPSGGARRALGGGASVTVSIDRIEIATSAQSAPGIAADIRAALADALEGLGLEMGAAS